MPLTRGERCVSSFFRHTFLLFSTYSSNSILLHWLPDTQTPRDRFRTTRSKLHACHFYLAIVIGSQEFTVISKLGQSWPGLCKGSGYRTDIMLFLYSFFFFFLLFQLVLINKVALGNFKWIVRIS